MRFYAISCFCIAALAIGHAQSTKTVRGQFYDYRQFGLRSHYGFTPFVFKGSGKTASLQSIRQDYSFGADFEIRHTPKFSEWVELDYLGQNYTFGGESLYRLNHFHFSIAKDYRYGINSRLQYLQGGGTYLQYQKTSGIDEDFFRERVQPTFQYRLTDESTNVSGEVSLRGFTIGFRLQAGLRVEITEFFISESRLGAWVSILSDGLNAEGVNVSPTIFLGYGGYLWQDLLFPVKQVEPYLRYELLLDNRRGVISGYRRDWGHEHRFWLGIRFKFSLVAFG